MHRRRDQDEQDIGETQAKLRDAIEENGRLITESQELIERYRRRWKIDRSQPPHSG